jgi:DNA-binding SARP family transcriptional activator
MICTKIRPFGFILLFFAFSTFQPAAKASGQLQERVMNMPKDSLEYGISITTYPHSASEFTSLALRDGKAIPLRGKEFGMRFSLRCRPDNVLGSIFRIITDKGDNVDLMFTVKENDLRQPMLVASDQVYLVDKEIRFGEWVDVSISLNPRTGEIRLVYDGKAVSAKDAGTKGAESFRIAFGLCPFVGYTLGDVASVDIKDIVLISGSKVIDRWDLLSHSGDISYDSVNLDPASGENTHWLIDSYISFRNIFSLHLDSTPSIAFDGTSRFFIVDKSDVVRVFDPNSGTSNEVEVRGGRNPINDPNQLIWVGEPRNCLLAYNLDDDIYATLDLEAWRWSSSLAPKKDHSYWNNTAVWCSDMDALISFGGYGHYHYNNLLSFSYPFDSTNIEIREINEITPRYSSSSCLDGDTLYIFGGRGNRSGKQELYPKNYYDLYAINLRNLHVKPIWNFEGRPDDGDFVPSDDMILDKEGNCFYVMTNQGEGYTLLKIGVEEPYIQKASLPIKLDVSAQYTYMNLYPDSSGGKLYAAIILGNVDESSDVYIYVIDTPLIPVDDLLIAPPAENQSGMNDTVLYVLLSLAILAVALLVLFLVKRRKPSGEAPSMPASSSSAAEPRKEKKKFYDLGRSSVCFFGGFGVMDKDGRDITSKFTQTLKSLLVLLIFHTDKYKGISSNKLNHLLWSYKPDDSANNNRNVYMSKLRLLLEEIGDISIINQNKMWSIRFGDEVICDYLEVQKLLSEKDVDNSDKLLELLGRGVMLPNMELDWLDEFKRDFSSVVIDYLAGLLARDDISEDKALEIDDIIFSYDFLNEDALKSKCSILYNTSRAGLAKSVYDQFCKDYKVSLGIEYPETFSDTIAQR